MTAAVSEAGAVFATLDAALPVPSIPRMKISDARAPSTASTAAMMKMPCSPSMKKPRVSSAMSCDTAAISWNSPPSAASRTESTVSSGMPGGNAIPSIPEFTRSDRYAP